jgi:hypothetical protein
MKGLLMIFVCTVLFSEGHSIVSEFHLLTNKDDELKFIVKYHNNESATVQAYVCAVEMKQAEYPINPISKLKIFNRTKKKLNILIRDNPENIDLRYVRLLLQEQTPSILGYKDNIEEDKKFLKNEFDLKNISKDLKEYIYQNTSL